MAVLSKLLGALSPLGSWLVSAIVDKLWEKIEERLDKFFEVRNEIKAISTEAGQLKEELKSATTDAEYDAILGKISDFSARIKL